MKRWTSWRRRRGDRRWPAAVALTLLLVGSLGGCVQHPAAPARTADGYQAAVGKTVGAATSSVATTKLLAESATRGDAMFPYLSVAVTDAEDDLGSTTETFSSIQPPDDESVSLRSRTMDVLQRAGGDVSSVRIIIRSGSTEGLPDLIAALDADERALSDLEST